jgi:hypothetical protein
MWGIVPVGPGHLLLERLNIIACLVAFVTVLVVQQGGTSSMIQVPKYAPNTLLHMHPDTLAGMSCLPSSTHPAPPCSPPMSSFLPLVAKGHDTTTTIVHMSDQSKPGAGIPLLLL